MSTGGHTAVVTGGNTGIGAAIAQGFLADGFDVVSLSRRKPEWNHPKLRAVEVDLIPAQVANLGGAQPSQMMCRLIRQTLVVWTPLTGPLRSRQSSKEDTMAAQIVMDHTGDSRHLFNPADAAAVADAEERFKTLTGAGDAEELNAALITSDFFPMLGVNPVLGRSFTPEEDQIRHI